MPPVAHAAPPSIVVIGGGFSGTMVAANLLRMARASGRPLGVTLIERRSQVGRGAAYATQDEAHLLNVPARGMSAWTEQPEDFLAWIRARRPGTEAGDFVPRAFYALYLDETLRREVEASKSVATFTTLHDEAERVEATTDRAWTVRCHGGSATRADMVVIATGHRPPSDPLHGKWTGPRDRWVADPWRPEALARVGPDDSIALIGSGLTAMDLCLSLCRGASERAGRVHLLSRSGLLPRMHVVPSQPPVEMLAVLNELAFSGGVSRIRSLVRSVRAIARRTLAAGGDWRAVIDGLRPYTHGLWGAMPLAERRRFFRHVRSLWEVHRHRMAPQVGERIEALRRSGALVTLRARPVAVEASGDAVTLRYRERQPDGTSRDGSITVRWVVNCTGPSATVGHAEDHVAASLIEAGFARMDPLGLGFETDQLGRPIGRDGRFTGGLWVIGSLRRPALWETTAVPELRGQAESIARECIAAIA
ncbi:MAG: FAD/NAD(P)-binding protein [Planctomycetota bacterium]